MGEDSAANLFYKTNDDGTYTQIEPANFTESEYTTTAEIPETELPVVTLGRMEPVEMDEKFFRCGSRKRYVKLLMAHGFSRNLANIWAQAVQIVGESYRTVYSHHLFDGSLNMFSRRAKHG